MRNLLIFYIFFILKIAHSLGQSDELVQDTVITGSNTFEVNYFNNNKQLQKIEYYKNNKQAPLIKTYHYHPNNKLREILIDSLISVKETPLFFGVAVLSHDRTLKYSIEYIYDDNWNLIYQYNNKWKNNRNESSNFKTSCMDTIFKFFQDGNVEWITTYIECAGCEKAIQYYQNGQLKAKIECEDGKIWNILEYYDQNGNELKIGNFNNGRGSWIHYDENGKPVKRHIYKNGKCKKDEILN